MYKRIALILLLILLPVMALAQTQEEWNLSCNYKTAKTTTVYVLGQDNVVQEVIPANTYVKIYDSIGDDVRKIQYMIGGVTRKGKVSTSSLVRCSSQYRKPDGWAENVHELDPNHDKILESNTVILVAPSLLQEGNKDYSGLNFTDPDSPFAQAAQQTAGRENKVEEQTPAATPVPSSMQSASRSASAQTDHTAPASEHTVQIDLVQLGAFTTTVKHEGREIEVPTSGLQFSDDVPDGKRLASILAPRTGRCYLRAKASSKGDVSGKCKAGTVVQVVKYGKNYCQIVYEGQVGYVQTACLTFLDPSANVLGTTVLTYNGRATGAAQVPIRNTASNDSCIIVKLRSGTEVTVMAKAGKWYEIAYEGLHGFVHENFMDAEIK